MLLRPEIQLTAANRDNLWAEAQHNRRRIPRRTAGAPPTVCPPGNDHARSSRCDSLLDSLLPKVPAFSSCHSVEVPHLRCNCPVLPATPFPSVESPCLSRSWKQNSLWQNERTCLVLFTEFFQEHFAHQEVSCKATLSTDQSSID